MKILPLLQLLADGELFSDTRLCAQLELSPSALAELLDHCRLLGLPIHCAANEAGHRLESKLELLHPQRIRHRLGDTGAGLLLRRLEIHPVLPSTNDWLLQQAADGAPSGTVCFAEAQTAGRGRMGRRWLSPLGSGILLSLLWHFDVDTTLPEGISLAVAVAVVEALQDLGFTGLGVKWPNDIQWQGSKIAGILLDLRTDAAGRQQLVMGLGLNVRLPAAAPQPTGGRWIDLASTDGPAISRNRLAAELLNHLLPLVAEYRHLGFAPWRSRWQDLDVLRGRRVMLSTATGATAGVADGVDPSGALWLRTAEGRQRYSGGELSLRPAE